MLTVAVLVMTIGLPVQEAPDDARRVVDGEAGERAAEGAAASQEAGGDALPSSPADGPSLPGPDEPPAPPQHPLSSWGSVDLYGGYGLSLGNSTSWTGVRLNVRDEGVDTVRGLNVTLWSPDPRAARRIDGIALGLVAPRAYELRGIAAGLFGTSSVDISRGIAVAGIVNHGQGDLSGVQAAGFSNVAGGALDGLHVAGLANVSGRGQQGAALAGIANVSNGELDGLALAGIANVADGGGRGLQGALVANVLDGPLKGAGLAGVANVAGGEVAGLGVAGIANVCEGGFRGLGVAGVANVCEGAFTGVGVSGVATVSNGSMGLLQVSGIATVAEGHMRGVQVGGLATTADGDMAGAQLSLGATVAGGTARGLLAGGLAAVADETWGLTLGGLFVRADATTGITLGGLAVLGHDPDLAWMNLFDFLRPLPGAEQEPDGGETPEDGARDAPPSEGDPGEDAPAEREEPVRIMARDGFVPPTHRASFTGLTASLLHVWADDATGLVLSGAYNDLGTLRGLAASAVNRVGERQQGLVVGLFNHAADLSGVQIGLLNHVESNPPGLRWLPLVNARF